MKRSVNRNPGIGLASLVLIEALLGLYAWLHYSPDGSIYPVHEVPTFDPRYSFSLQLP